MEKKYFLILWTLLFFTGYFLYFSPLSLYHLSEKISLIQKLEKKNGLLKNYNESVSDEKIDLEKNNYFYDMGYSQNNQTIVDIRLPPTMPLPQNPSGETEEFLPPQNHLLWSGMIFFFFLSLMVIFFLIYNYEKKPSKP